MARSRPAMFAEADSDLPHMTAEPAAVCMAGAEFLPTCAIAGTMKQVAWEGATIAYDPDSLGTVRAARRPRHAVHLHRRRLPRATRGLRLCVEGAGRHRRFGAVRVRPQRCRDLGHLRSACSVPRPTPRSPSPPQRSGAAAGPATFRFWKPAPPAPGSPTGCGRSSPTAATADRKCPRGAFSSFSREFGRPAKRSLRHTEERRNLLPQNPENRLFA